MEEQTEETISEKTLSDEEFDPNQFVDEDDENEWDSASQVSGISETSTSKDHLSISSVWLYFDRNPEFAPDYNICKTCSKKYKQSSSVTTLRKHLLAHQLEVPTRAEKKGKKSVDPFGKKEQKEHDEYLVQWLIRDLQPFAVVDDASFRAFINFFCPRYVIPDRHKAKGTTNNFFSIHFFFYDDNI